MKSYQGLTFKYLIQQGKRTVVTLIGIILSVALITSIGVIGESIKATQVAQQREYGDYHGRFQNLTKGQLAILSNQIKLEKIGITINLGGYEVKGTGTTLLLGGWNQVGLDMFNIHLKSGKLPIAPNEIALEEKMLEMFPFPVVQGQSITLPFEHTYKDQAGYFQTLKGEGTFIVTGILEKTVAQVTRRSLGLVTIEGTERLLPDERRVYTAFASVKEGYPIRETLEEIRRSVGVTEDGLDYQEGLLHALGESTKTNWPLLFLALVVVVASIAAIYNILHISVMERIRQFGMLRSMGATPVQIRKIVLGEALVLSIIGIPVGFLLGLLITVILNKTFSILQMVITEIHVPLWLIFGVTFLSLLGIFFSTWSPARLAGKVSPLQAIKVTTGVLKDGTERQRKWHTLLQKLSGITGRMAYQNLWRNRKRLLVTVFSISLGVVLFIVFSFFATNANPQSVLEGMMAGDFVLDFEVWGIPGYTKEDFQKVESVSGVKEVIRVQRTSGATQYSEEEITPEYRERLLTGPYAVKKDAESQKYPIQTEILGFKPEVLSNVEKHLMSGVLPKEQSLTDPQVVLVDTLTERGTLRSGLAVGDRIEYRSYYHYEGKLKYHKLHFIIAGIVSEPPISMGYGIPGPRLLVDEALFEQLFGFEGYSMLVVNLEADADQKAVESRLQQIVKGVTQGQMASFQEAVAKLEQEKRQILYMIYGLIAVVSLIGIFNIMNTLSTNLILRTREFGTMRAVGMTHQQLKQMIRLEGIYYGVLSAFWGSIIGILLAFILYILLREQMEYLKWLWPWKAVTLAWLGSIGIGLLATYAPLKRIAATTTIDALRAID